MTTCVTKEAFDENNVNLADSLKELDDRLSEVESSINCSQSVFKFGFIANLGWRNDGGVQDAVAAQMITKGVEFLFFGGNMNTPEASPSLLTTSLLPWQPWIDDEKCFPSYGPAELDWGDLGQHVIDKFPYVAVGKSNKRYYKQTFDEGKIEFFVLTSGKQIDDTLVEPDGIAIDSVQYDWYRSEIINSCVAKKHKRFVVHPGCFVTGRDPIDLQLANTYDVAYDWIFENDKVNMLVGGGRVNEVFDRSGMKIFGLDGVSDDEKITDPLDAILNSNAYTTREFKTALGVDSPAHWAYVEIHNSLTLVQLIDAATGTVSYSTILT